MAKEKLLTDEEKIWDFVSLLVFVAYAGIMHLLTRFWPFSLYWRNKMFHYEHRHLYRTLSKVEDYLEKIAVTLLVKDCSENDYFFEVKGKFLRAKRVLGAAELEEQLRKGLAKEYDSIYVRTDEPGVHTILLSKKDALSS